jgi:hypothetical protein
MDSSCISPRNLHIVYSPSHPSARSFPFLCRYAWRLRDEVREELTDKLREESCRNIDRGFREEENMLNVSSSLGNEDTRQWESAGSHFRSCYYGYYSRPYHCTAYHITLSRLNSIIASIAPIPYASVVLGTI